MTGAAPRLARLGLALFALGAAGTLVELLLLGHVEDWQQWVPVVLLGAGVPAAAALAWRPGSATVRTVQGLGVLYVVAGVVGTWLHYRGNAEFEREMAPDAAGWPLVREALTGATPALAPGTMVWFGLLALLVAAAMSDRPAPPTLE